MHRNIISIVKPTRCTTVSNLFYFRMTLYTFRTVFPSIIRSSRLYIQQPNRYCCLLASRYLVASRQQYLFDKCLLLYVQSQTPDDGQKNRPKHVECHSEINEFDTLVHLVGFTIGLPSCFVHLVYISALLVAFCCCSFLLHVVVDWLFYKYMYVVQRTQF